MMYHFWLGSDAETVARQFNKTSKTQLIPKARELIEQDGWVTVHPKLK